MSRPRQRLWANDGPLFWLRGAWWLGTLSFLVVASPCAAPAQQHAVLSPPLVPLEFPGVGFPTVQKQFAVETGLRPKELAIQVDLPKPGQVFRVESEAAFRDRLRLEAQQQKLPIAFPKDAVQGGPGGGSFAGPYPPRTTYLVPSVLCYRPLYFEDRNTERYGWYVPGLQPLISAGHFYLRLLVLPCSLTSRPPWSWECNTGYPLPGDPVPYTRWLIAPNAVSKMP